MPLRERPKPFSPQDLRAPLDRVEEPLSLSVMGVEGEDEMEAYNTCEEGQLDMETRKMFFSAKNAEN